MAYIEIGLERFAKFDPSISRSRIVHQVHIPKWEDVYIHLLKQRDYKSAELVRVRNSWNEENSSLAFHG
jgi:hypothetical protein